MGFVALALIMMLVLFMSIAYSYAASVPLREAILVRHLCDAMRNNMPLASSLYLAARSESGWVARSLNRVAQLIEVGMPLSAAVQNAWRGCSAQTISILETGEKAGMLPHAAAAVERHYERSVPRDFSSGNQQWIIFLISSCALLAVTGFMRVFTAPKITEIAADNDRLSMNGIGQVLMGNGTTGATGGWNNLFDILLVIVAILIPVIAIIVPWRFHGRRINRVRAVSNIIDVIRRRIPLLKSLAVARSCAATTPTLRFACAAGMPLPDAVRLAAHVDVDAEWSRTLNDWSRRMSAGTAPLEAAKQSAIPAAYLHYLAIGLRGNALIDSLERIEEYYIFESERRERDLMRFLWPMLTLLLASGVAIISLSLFKAMDAIVVSIMNSPEMPA